MATTKTKKKAAKKKNGKKPVSVKRNGKVLYGAVALNILKKRAAKKRAATAKTNPPKKATKKAAPKKAATKKTATKTAKKSVTKKRPTQSLSTAQLLSLVKQNPQLRQAVAGLSAKKASKKSNSAKKRPRRNPPAGELYETFTGLPHTGHDIVTAPTGAPSNLDQCGQFVEFKWIDLDGKRHTVNLEQQGIPAILAAHRFANSHDELFLVSAPGLPLPNFGDYLPKGDNGYIYEVTYRAQKAHLGDTKPQLYYHTLGEETGQPPVLHINKDGELIFKGGEYWIEATGIHN